MKDSLASQTDLPSPHVSSDSKSRSRKRRCDKKKKKQRRKRRCSPSVSSESGRDEAQQAEKPAGQRGVSEAVPHSTSTSQVELLSTEAGCFGLDEPQESVAWETASLVLAWETASPELGPELMDCKLEDNSEAPTPCVAAGFRSDIQVVADQLGHFSV